MILRIETIYISDGRTMLLTQEESETHVLIHTSFREESQQLQFAQRAQAEQGMLEGEDLLDRDLSSRGLVQRGHHGTVGPFT